MVVGRIRPAVTDGRTPEEIDRVLGRLTPFVRVRLPDDGRGHAVNPSFHAHDQVPHIGHCVVDYNLGNGPPGSPFSP